MEIYVTCKMTRYRTTRRGVRRDGWETVCYGPFSNQDHATDWAKIKGVLHYHLDIVDSIHTLPGRVIKVQYPMYTTEELQTYLKKKGA